MTWTACLMLLLPLLAGGCSSDTALPAEAGALLVEVLDDSKRPVADVVVARASS